jgi:hypothetical protein
MMQEAGQLVIWVVNSSQMYCVLRLRSKVVQASKATEESAMIKLSAMSTKHSPVCNSIHSKLKQSKLPVPEFHRNEEVHISMVSEDRRNHL